MRQPGRRARAAGGKSLRHAFERWFAAWGHFAYRRAWLVILAVLAVTGTLATRVPNLEIDTSTEGFLREDDPIRVEYQAFRRQYGRDDMILLAIEAPRIFDLGFLEKLRALHREIESGVPKLQEVTSLVNARETRGEGDELVVRELLADWPQTPEELAALEARALANPLYRDNLLSEDGRVTTIVIETDAYSSLGEADDAHVAFAEAEADSGAAATPRPFITGEENGEIVSALNAIVERHQGPDFQIHVAGGPTMVDYLSRAVARDMQRFTGLALLAIGGLLFALFRRVAAVILPLLVVILSLITTLALMGILGTPITLPTQILPSFLLAVGVGDSVHVLAIFYQRLRAGDDKQQAIAGALAHSGLAITVTSLTTAGGLFSFLTAQIAPVADLGVFGPVGVMMALVFTILLLPSLIAVFPMRAPREARSKRPAFTQRVLVLVGEFSARHAVSVSLVWVGITAVSVFGALQVRFAHDPMSWFPEDDPFRVANEFVNERLNGTMFLEVVVDTGRENGLHDPELLHRLDDLRRFALGFQKGDVFVGKTVSPADVLKEIHQALNENRREFYAIPDDRELVAQEFLLFESAGSDDLEKLVDSRFSQGRMTLKFPFLDAIQYGAYLDVLEARFRELLGDRAEPHFTGLLVMAGRTIDAVIYSLASSYVTSFVVIAPLMILMIGSIRLGLLSMLPNVVPVVVTLGLMGWLGMPLDAFTLLIGSIALGLAVDDTTHFLHNFRSYYEQSGDAVAAVHETLATTGQAMLFTSLVLSSGFFVYMFASMDNLFNFGLLSGFTILVACVAEIFLTPALLTLFARPARERSVSSVSHAVPSQ